MALPLFGCAAVFDQELQRAKEARAPVFLGSLAAREPDAHGKIDVQAQLFNTSDNVYKYVDVSLIAYNRVGDPIRRSGQQALPTVTLRLTGPLRPRRTSGKTRWPGVWYVQKVDCLEVSRIDITHMDGQIVRVDGDDLMGVLAADVAQGCAHG